MKRNRAVVAIKRTLLVVFSTLLLLVFAVVGVVYVVLCGPSVSAQELLTRSLKETSAIGFIPDLFLPKERVEEIMGYKEDTVETEETDTSLVTITATKREPGEEDAGTGNQGTNGIEFVEVMGASYRGILMIVEDPTRIFLGTPDSYGGKGLTLEEMIEKYDAIGGINAGGFDDPNGTGKGGTPDGIVISGGELLWGTEGTYSTVIGFDGEGILHVGNMTAREAMAKNLQWACSFGPALIVNGEALSNAKTRASGVNPRTAIGQRADGAVLLLVVDGRQVTSLGATMEDLISILLENGAVNAANLDGGSSSQMIYNDEALNLNSSVKGPRSLPTSFLVRR